MGIAENWSAISGHLLPIALLLAGSTFLLFGLSGCLTQWILRKGGKSND